LLVLHPASLQAQSDLTEVECADGWPARCSVEILAGEKARFDGQLFTPDMAIYLGQSTNACDERIKAEVARTSSTAKEDQKRDIAIINADHKAEKRVLEVERDAYKEAADRSFLEYPVVVSIVTAAVLIGLFVTVKKIDRTTE
jgi:hypothetical protein